MPITSEQIKQLDNPYKKLNSFALLTEHQDELDKLSPKEMNHLATKMLLACPKEEMEQFTSAINEFKQSQSKYFPTLYSALETRMRITTLLDPEHPSPHSLLSGEDFDQDLFKEFDTLAIGLLRGNEVALATRLALTTPAKDRSSLAFTLASTFPQSECAQKVGAAFNLRRQIDNLLLKGQPQKFFTSEEYNPDLCREFSPLFSSLLKGHEQKIGEQLSQLSRGELSKICRELEQLSPSAHDKEHPFKLIAAAITVPQEEPQQKIEQSESGVRNRYHRFNSSPSVKSEATTASTSNSKTNADTEEEKDCNFCGLFNW